MAILDPAMFKQELCRLLSRPQNVLNRYRYGPGTDVMAEDWDNLIILDACRYDAFEQVNTFQGTLQSRTSKGGSSRGFIENNFKEKELHDTVYITANPFVGLIEHNTFHAVISLLDDWDTEQQTVLPATVVDAVESFYDDYSDKRLVIHFMQPHQPYLGKQADAIKSSIEAHTDSIGWNNEKRTSPDQSVKRPGGMRHYEAAVNPEIDVTREDVWEAYLETLEIALEHVERLFETLDGKTVLTADHGELLGECPYICSIPKYGHFRGEWIEQLRVVPWFIIDSGERRTITTEPPERYDTIDEEQLDEKLGALGYK